LRKAVGQCSSKTSVKVQAKEPELYDGTRSTKVIGNFCLDVEKYLRQLGTCLEEDNIRVAAKYLTRNAKLWWRSRLEQIVAGHI